MRHPHKIPRNIYKCVGFLDKVNNKHEAPPDVLELYVATSWTKTILMSSMLVNTKAGQAKEHFLFSPFSESRDYY